MNLIGDRLAVDAELEAGAFDDVVKIGEGIGEFGKIDADLSLSSKSRSRYGARHRPRMRSEANRSSRQELNELLGDERQPEPHPIVGRHLRFVEDRLVVRVVERDHLRGTLSGSRLIASSNHRVS